MTTPDEHDVEPCFTGSKVSVRCRTHQADTTEQWDTVADAIRDFACDDGRELRFVLETWAGAAEPALAVMRDLSGLRRAVRASAEARAYGYDDGRISAWLWLGGGATESLEITADGMSEYDEDDYATASWKVTGSDGRLITRVLIRVDGRA
jgi:hypothetical protein